MSAEIITTSLELSLAYLVAIMSPGPSIVAILRNSLFDSYKIGVITALGTVTGIALQALYVLVGLNFLHKNPNVLWALNLCCSLYLIYFGVKVFINRNRHLALGLGKNTLKIKGELEAFKQGFLIDALNPLALSFFLAIFTLFISEQATFYDKGLYWLEIVAIGSIWFVGLSFIFKNERIRAFIIQSLGSFLNKAVPILFIFFGIRLLAFN